MPRLNIISDLPSRHWRLHTSVRKGYILGSWMNRGQKNNSNSKCIKMINMITCIIMNRWLYMQVSLTSFWCLRQRTGQHLRDRRLRNCPKTVSWQVAQHHSSPTCCGTASGVACGTLTRRERPMHESICNHEIYMRLKKIPSNVFYRAGTNFINFHIQMSPANVIKKHA